MYLSKDMTGVPIKCFITVKSENRSSELLKITMKNIKNIPFSRIFYRLFANYEKINLIAMFKV